MVTATTATTRVATTATTTALSVEARQTVVGKDIAGAGGTTLFGRRLLEVLGALTTAVEADDLKGALGGDRHQTYRRIAHRAISNLTLEVIGLKVIVAVGACLKDDFTVGQGALRFGIGIDLEVHTALDLPTLPRELLRIHRDILHTGSPRTHRGEGRHPRGAAELTTTRTDTPDATCLLASTDLLHLDAHVEGICEHTDELAEVHTPVSDVVEDRLVAIALIFDVPDLHVEAQRRGDLSSLDHRRLFTALGFLPALEVTRAGDAVDVEELALVRAVAMVPHRQLGELTSVGGEILFVESSLQPGQSGKLILTGSLGDVMKESATLALSYIRAHATQLGIDLETLKDQEIHIHVPEGAIPKDGPSAGITMVTSLVSAMTRRRVRAHLAMTGEITLRGKVLPVGGIKEKILAAKRSGITDIILCRENEKDILEINEHYLEGLNFHYVDEITEVLDFALLDEIVDKAK